MNLGRNISKAKAFGSAEFSIAPLGLEEGFHVCA
jgi:hypothetical protein